MKAINWHMDECEHFGLLKVDILGLNNLYVLKDTADLVRGAPGNQDRLSHHRAERSGGPGHVPQRPYRRVFPV